MSDNTEYYQIENNYRQLSNKLQLKLNSDNVDIPNTNNSSRGELFQFTQNFYKMDIKEIEPTTQNINETIFEEDLSIIIDELVNLIFMDLNKGKEENVRKKQVFDYIKHHNLDSQEIYNWLLNNQINSNSIYLLG